MFKIEIQGCKQEIRGCKEVRGDLLKFDFVLPLLMVSFEASSGLDLRVRVRVRVRVEVRARVRMLLMPGA